MIDLTVRESSLLHGVERARQQQVAIPTMAQMKDPSLIPASIVERLKGVGLWEVDPLNLFRIN